jgi:MYXO-CTERM domain-containing protein
MNAHILVDAAPRPAAGSGCGTAGAFGSGAVLALPILLVVALLGRRHRRRG